MQRIAQFCVAAVVATGIGLAATAGPAAAAASFVTPRYGMTCSTAVTGGIGAYQGSATCFTPVVAKWKVRVNCSFGGTYDSLWVYTSSTDGWKRWAPANTCVWGVNSVQVIEGS
jgi:hypothetical protein